MIILEFEKKFLPKLSIKEKFSTHHKKILIFKNNLFKFSFHPLLILSRNHALITNASPLLTKKKKTSNFKKSRWRNAIITSIVEQSMPRDSRQVMRGWVEREVWRRCSMVLGSCIGRFGWSAESGVQCCSRPRGFRRENQKTAVVVAAFRTQF